MKSIYVTLTDAEHRALVKLKDSGKEPRNWHDFIVGMVKK